jgi:putative tryptophan/tyrosine transport system substrate-binding protein
MMSATEMSATDRGSDLPPGRLPDVASPGVRLGSAPAISPLLLVALLAVVYFAAAKLGLSMAPHLRIEWRFAEGRNERLPQLASELVSLKVDAIFAINTQAAQAAKSATGAIPIIIARVADPVRSGLVASLARPGGNVTGLSAITEELSAKRLQLLKEAVPKAVRVAVVWNSGNPGVAITVQEMEAASPQFGLRLHVLPARGANDLPKIFEAIINGRADAVFVLDDVLITSYEQRILDWTMKNHLPVISLYREFVEAGALIAYGPSIREMYRRAAYFVDKILKGAKPGDLPVEQPTKFELVINLRTAQALGLTIPQSLLQQADETIQ